MGRCLFVIGALLAAGCEEKDCRDFPDESSMTAMGETFCVLQCEAYEVVEGRYGAFCGDDGMCRCCVAWPDCGVFVDITGMTYCASEGRFCSNEIDAYYDCAGF